MIPKEQLKQKVKNQIIAYKQHNFAKEFPMHKTAVCNFLAGRREFSYEKLLYINDFFSKK